MLKKRILFIICIFIFIINLGLYNVAAMQDIKSNELTSSTGENKNGESGNVSANELKESELKKSLTENNKNVNENSLNVMENKTSQEHKEDSNKKNENNTTNNSSTLKEDKKEKNTIAEASNKISDGIYVIASALNTSKVLDISEGSTLNNANVQIWNNARVDQQKFSVKHIKDGYYTITSLKSSKVLDVKGAGTADGTNVQQHSSNNTDAQKWLIKDVSDGYYSIISKCNGLYLNVSNTSISNGTNVNVSKANNTKAQKFKFIKPEEFYGTQTISNGIYTIKSALNQSKVLDVSAASTASGANIQIWNNVNVSQQKFIVTYTGNGFYAIESLRSGKVLDVLGAENTNCTNVQQYEKNGNVAQKWVIKDAGDGYNNIISRCGGLYLDVAYAETKNGTNVFIHEGNGTKAQKFKFEKIDLGGKKTLENGTYIIASLLNTNKVLDISGGATNSGANLQIWDNANVKQQKFLVTYLNNGFYKITCQRSSKVLDVAGAGNENCTNVQQYQPNGTTAQQWIIKDVGDGYYSIISRCNGLYLDVAYAGTSNGTNIFVHEGNGTKAQKFKFIRVESNGIDVSSWQGDIDWTKVKNTNIDFAMLRVGYRGYETGKIAKDSKFDTNIKEATKNAIDCGVYFVTQAINYNEGVEEANWVLNNIKGYNITCPITIDVEWAGGSSGNNGRADYISVDQRTKAIKGFCDTIKKAGYNPMIYANKEWLMYYIDMNKLSDFDVWLAHYVAGAPDNKSDYKGKYTYWQYTATGKCDGINGNVDLNKRYIDI